MNLKYVASWLVGSFALYGVVSACSGSPDGGSAHAQETGGTSSNGGSSGCGSCTVPEKLRVITADSDLEQHVGGATIVAAGQAWQSLGAGPFYLTDARLGGGSVSLAVAPAAGGCEQGVDLMYLGSAEVTSVGSGPLSGGRILIAADQQLCAQNPSSSSASALTWSGFRPY